MKVKKVKTEEMGISHKRPEIIVGIDFGTTYSGVAWALARKSDEVEVLQSWPGGGNHTSQKVPTTLSFQGSTIRWGYQVDPFGESIQGVKLLLDETQCIPYGPSIDSAQIIKQMHKDAVTVSGEYLRKLTTHGKEVLRRRFGDAFETMNLQYILTVPAVWSDKAKDATRRAAHLAGIPLSDLILVSEPEAAAMCAIRTIQPNTIKVFVCDTHNGIIEEAYQMQVDDCLVVCDAGGGTVDLISYRVNQVEPLRVEEVTEGTGGICGSVMLDQRFEELLIRKIGEREYKELSTAAKATSMERWKDYIKPNYTGPFDEFEGEDPGYFVPVPMFSKDPSLQRGVLHIERDQVEAIFGPIVSQVEKLVENQIKQVKECGSSTKAIILVGGLGASEYLFRRLKKKFEAITVMQPPNAWSAVVRGAVFRGQGGNQVDNRIARCHYGVKFRTPFDKSVHGPFEESLDKEWCPYEEKWFETHRMKWYIEKAHQVSENKPIRMVFYATFGVSESMVFQERLYFCEKKMAPSKRTSDVHSLCTLEADLSKIPRDLFEKCQNSKGEEYYKVTYDLVLTPTSASLLFDLEFNGVSYGAVRSFF